MKRKINPQANNNNRITFSISCDTEKASLQSLNNFKRPFKLEYINLLLPQKLFYLWISKVRFSQPKYQNQIIPKNLQDLD